jgi:hypothetical protein
MRLPLCVFAYCQSSCCETCAETLLFVAEDEDTTKVKPFRIGNRGSPLAMAQAFENRTRLQEQFPEFCQDGAILIYVMKTRGV